MVSMGFACTENIMYVIDGGYQVAVLRAFTAVPAHATFGVLMGFYMGKAKFSNNRLVLNLTGLLLATLFHGAYDFFLFINFIPGISIGAFISLAIGIVLAKKAIKAHQDNSNFKSL
jgi:RsiW-degrading membrane proteinase PrsW (M82 family)